MELVYGETDLWFGIERQIEFIIRETVRTERERCAKIAEKSRIIASPKTVCEIIAAAIRAKPRAS